MAEPREHPEGPEHCVGCALHRALRQHYAASDGFGPVGEVLSALAGLIAEIVASHPPEQEAAWLSTVNAAIANAVPEMRAAGFTHEVTNVRPHTQQLGASNVARDFEQGSHRHDEPLQTGDFEPACNNRPATPEG